MKRSARCDDMPARWKNNKKRYGLHGRRSVDHGLDIHATVELTVDS